jgi:hypothetical protein
MQCINRTILILLWLPYTTLKITVLWELKEEQHRLVIKAVVILLQENEQIEHKLQKLNCVHGAALFLVQE